MGALAAGLRRLQQGALAQACRWNPNSRLAVIGDGAGWVLDIEADQVIRAVQRAGGRAFMASSPWPNQPVFFASRVAALREIERRRGRGASVCFPYFHGYPGEGNAMFDDTYMRFRRHHAAVARVQVTHPRMRSLLLEAGIAAAKVHTILIGVDTQAFAAGNADRRRAVRERLGIPQASVVIGSFQKDGEGWGDGFVPKLIKGPDIALKTLELLKASVPDLFVLLSGPSRGFVRRGLEAAGIPYVHTLVSDYRDVPSLYQALDAYLVASRQEGGPKAVLESMASGVPIVSTRVGQAPELIRHGVNGWLADIDDAEALTDGLLRSLDTDWRLCSQATARLTAEEHDHARQAPQWLAFFDGLLRFPEHPARGGN